MAGLGEALGSLVTRRPDDQFSPEDQYIRDRILSTVSPEQIAMLDQTQRELWRNQFQQQMPQSLQGRPSLSPGLYRMPVINPPTVSSIVPDGFRPGGYAPSTDFSRQQSPVNYAAGTRYGR